MTGRVVHFEVPYDDGERARAFYSDVFGWAIQYVPEFEYNLVQTGPTDDTGMPSRTWLHRRRHVPAPGGHRPPDHHDRGR